MNRIVALMLALFGSALAGGGHPLTPVRTGQTWEVIYQATGEKPQSRLVTLGVVDLQSADRKDRSYTISPNSSESFRIIEDKNLIYLQIFNPFVLCVSKIQQDYPYHGFTIIGKDDVIQKYTSKPFPSLEEGYRITKEAKLGRCILRRVK